MPLLVSEFRGGSAAPEIVIRSIGPDGMETNRDFLTLEQAERHVVAVRRAIERSRASAFEPAGTAPAPAPAPAGSSVAFATRPQRPRAAGRRVSSITEIESKRRG